MLLHFLELLRSQFSGLEQDLIRNSDLADIMQFRCLFEYIKRSNTHAESLTDNAGVPSDTDDVAASIVVPEFGRTC